MRNILISISLVLTLILGTLNLGGCANGVQLNKKYSDLLDQTAAQAKDSADRAESTDLAIKLTPDQSAKALRGNANVWQEFKDARDGKATQ